MHQPIDPMSVDTEGGQREYVPAGRAEFGRSDHAPHPLLWTRALVAHATRTPQSHQTFGSTPAGDMRVGQ
jgi:hypothetical protein